MKYLIHGHCTRTNLPGDPINHVNLLYNSFLLVLTKATLGWYLNTTLYGTVVHVFANLEVKHVNVKNISE